MYLHIVLFAQWCEAGCGGIITSNDASHNKAQPFYHMSNLLAICNRAGTETHRLRFIMEYLDTKLRRGTVVGTVGKDDLIKNVFWGASNLYGMMSYAVTEFPFVLNSKESTLTKELCLSLAQSDNQLQKDNMVERSKRVIAVPPTAQLLICQFEAILDGEYESVMLELTHNLKQGDANDKLLYPKFSTMDIFLKLYAQ